MQSLTEYKPIASLSIPGIPIFQPSGLIAIVGPNSSGKTRLLRDIDNYMNGSLESLVVATDIEIASVPLDELLEQMILENLIVKLIETGGSETFLPNILFAGTGQTASQFARHHAHQYHQVFEQSIRDGNIGPSNMFRANILRYLVRSLFLDRRLVSLTSTGVIQFSTQPPQHELHQLHTHDSAKHILNEEIVKSFGKAVWPDTSDGTVICLKVSETGHLPPLEDRVSFRKSKTFRSLESEGDGLKSYAAICTSLLVSKALVNLIDEPEMCLHPPQAYNLGRFIAETCSNDEVVTFVSTHSSHVLRGMLDASKALQVIRLTRTKGTFTGHMVPSATIEKCRRTANIKSERILDGIFSDAVVIVEAEGDRNVYQCALESLESNNALDIHWMPVGGTGGIFDALSLYLSLNIPVGIIVDMDFLVDNEKIKRTLQELISDPVRSKELISRCIKLGESIMNLGPEVDPKEVSSELVRFSNESLNWGLNDDQRLKKDLRELANSLDRMRRLKGGLNHFEVPLRASIESLMADLRMYGLFVVPVGELEGWLAGRIGCSKTKKSQWASEAVERIREIGEEESDIWEFVRSVRVYLLNSLSRPDDFAVALSD